MESRFLPPTLMPRSKATKRAPPGSGRPSGLGLRGNDDLRPLRGPVLDPRLIAVLQDAPLDLQGGRERAVGDGPLLGDDDDEVELLVPREPAVGDLEVRGELALQRPLRKLL